MVISKSWSHFEVLQDQESLALQTQTKTNQIWNELGDKLQIVDNVIKFLNTRSMDDLKTLGIKDETSIIMDTNKVHTKRDLEQQDQSKCNVILR